MYGVSTIGGKYDGNSAVDDVSAFEVLLYTVVVSLMTTAKLYYYVHIQGTQ